ncbi:hypothetical protein [Kitasatospora sp. NPDC093558]|uniref:hypothetical protein n=1 Tax=Kitasatospora sp. NPDC093558 TaxID=3155201 RepID=UPI0034201DCF
MGDSVFRFLADEWDVPFATLRNRPTEWIPVHTSQEFDGFLWCLDLNYYNSGRTVTIQTARPLPGHERVGPGSTPESELWKFIADSHRIGPVPPDFDVTTGYTGQDIEFEGVSFPVHVHQAHGCSSTRIPLLVDGGSVIVTAADEHWATATDLVLNRFTPRR